MKLSVAVIDHVEPAPCGRLVGECGKRCYDSTRAARRANRRNGHTLRVYKCDECDAYHVTKRGGR